MRVFLLLLKFEFWNGFEFRYSNFGFSRLVFLEASALKLKKSIGPKENRMGMVSGGQLALEALLDKGGTKVFSLSGGHINPLYESAEGSPSEALHGYLIRS